GGRVGQDLAGGRPPLLEVVPEAVRPFVQARHLAVAAAAEAAEIDAPIHRDEVALQDVGLVVDLAVGIRGEAAATHGEHHPKRRVRPKRQHQAGPGKNVGAVVATHRPATMTRRMNGIARRAATAATRFCDTTLGRPTIRSEMPPAMSRVRARMPTPTPDVFDAMSDPATKTTNVARYRTRMTTLAMAAERAAGALPLSSMSINVHAAATSLSE